jgi:hypothetical protein
MRPTGFPQGEDPMNRPQARCKTTGTMFSILALVLIALSPNSWADTPCSKYGGKAWADSSGTNANGEIMAILTYNYDSNPGVLAAIHLLGRRENAGDLNCFGFAIKDDARGNYLLSTALSAYMAGKTVVIRSANSTVQYIWVGWNP